eukprot:3505866-Rhodomonas_salina.1
MPYAISVGLCHTQHTLSQYRVAYTIPYLLTVHCAISVLAQHTLSQYRALRYLSMCPISVLCFPISVPYPSTMHCIAYTISVPRTA